MKHILKSFIIIGSFIALCFNAALAQFNIQTTIGSYNSSNCSVGDTIILPVTINMATGIRIGAFSLAIDFDTSKLRCIPTVPGGNRYAFNIDSQLAGGLLSNVTIFPNLNPNPPYHQTTRRQFRAVWSSLSSAYLNGIMFNLRFVVLSTGNSMLKWDLVTAGRCEYGNAVMALIGNVSFVDGNVLCGSTSPPPSGITIPTLTSCLGDTASVTISHPALNGVANASLRMTYNPDSLTYVGFNSLNPAFNGMTISGGNGSVLMDWNTSTNQTIPSGNLVNLRFRVNGNSNLNWDTTTIPCEFSDVNFNVIPQTYVGGSITHNTQRLTWNRSICEGQSFNLGNQSYTTSGTYQGRLTGTGGACDTLITLNLNVIPTQTILPAVTTCSNQPYSFNGLSLTSSGTYFDTLINSLGCDSILQLNLTVNPAYNQNQSIVICTGTTYSFGGQNLSSSGTYSHTYTTQSGCDSLVQLNLSVADSVSIQSSNGSVGFCPGGSLRIGLSNAIPNVTYQWTKDGSIISGANSDSLLVTQGGTYRLTVQVSSTCSVASNPLTISVLNCNRITGDLKYDNNNQTPLAGVPVHLKTLLGNIVASDTTDAMGGYEITGYNNGNYVLDANVIFSWGGVNSTDALQVTRFFTSLITLSPLRVKAGDVNGNNITQSSDALLINRRITGVISAFSVGNFVNNLPSVSASGNPLMANLRVLSTGDVNGTYNPLPLAPALVLDTVYGNGNVGTAVVRFTTAGSGVFERGVVWSSSPNPTISSSKSVAGSGGFGFTHSFNSIDPNNIQYARAYARTSAGVYYSNERSFTPIPGLRCPGTPSVTDIDGNLYHTVQIGNQCWTQSNLKTSRYRNGDSIPTGLSNSDWGNTTSGAYAIYNNDPVNDGLYGKLYNWYAVNDSTGLCPTGWHVPSNADWEYIINYFGTGSFGPGGKMKSTGTQFWLSPNIGATNETGFSALPNGMRSSNGTFSGIGSYGYYWSTWSDHPSTRKRWEFRNSQTILAPFSVGIRDGYSIRCIKDYTPPTTGTINSLDCNNAGITGNLVVGYQANSVTSSVLYTNGNGGVHNGQIVESTGVTGLTATLSPGSFYPIVGSLIYTITGTPSSSGTARFALNIGGQTCTLVRTVNATTPPPASFPQGYVHCNPNNPTQIFDVTNPVTGVTWMDRNLGASQVATSSSDVNAYGDLFQWGRGSDGHQCRTSITTSLISSTDQPSHGNFIVLPSGSPGDWRNPQNNNLWQGVNGFNNPCPTGYRLPTDAEFNAEILSWYSNNALGAFNSPLKITMAGYRSWNGTISNTGTDCSYWSSTIFNSLSRRLTGPSTGYIGVGASYRAHGGSVRCLKD